MKKLLITVSALFSLSMGVWAGNEDHSGFMNEFALLKYTLPEEGGTLRIFCESGDQYRPMMNYTLNSEIYDRPWKFGSEMHEKIQSIDMQNGINIGNYAFYGLPNLTSVNLHSSDTWPIYCIGISAFEGSKMLATINSDVLTNLRYIGESAFAGTAIKTFTINKPTGGDLPQYLKTSEGFNFDLSGEHCYVAQNAFAGCDHLTTVYMKDVTPFSETYNNFLNNHTYLVVNDADVAATYRAAWSEIADQIICLEQNVVFGNETFKDICITNWDTNKDGELSYEEAFAVTTFGDAFKGDSTITEITLNDLMPFINVTIIGSGTFEGCTALEKITFPSHIEDIADDAFTGCTNLKEIHFTAVFPFKEEFTIQTNERTHIIVPDDYLSTYDNTWTDKSELIIGESHIPFQCPVTKDICVTKWDTDKDGELSYVEAQVVSTIGTTFKSNKEITSFEELQYFTSLKNIDNSAFRGCNSLTSISIPASVTTIGTNAYSSSYVFNGCSNLKKVIILDSDETLFFGFDQFVSSQTEIGIFKNCPLETIYIGRNVDYKKSGENSSPFNGNPSLKSVTLGDKVTNINNYLFFSCKNLTSIIFSENSKLANIGNYAFYGNFSLTSTNIPDGVTSLGEWSFANCTNLTFIYFSENSKLTSIGSNAFYQDNSLTSINIPDGVTSIGGSSFARCEGLTSVTFSENSKLTSIGSSAFYYSGNIKSITVPSGVTSIGSGAFTGVPEYIYFLNTTPITYDNFSDYAVYVVPDASIEAYKEKWGSDVAYRIIGASSLNGHEMKCTAAPTSSHLAELIGEENLLNVYKLKVSGSINSYDMMIMGSKMKNLRHLDLSEVTIVANTYTYNGSTPSRDNVFPGFLTGTNIISLLLPNTIYDLYVGQLTWLKSIIIPESVTEISYNAFEQCARLTKVEIPINSKLQKIQMYAFRNTYKLQALDLRNATQLTYVGGYTFENSGIETIHCPSSLTEFGSYVFNNCKNLRTYSGFASLGKYAFNGCTNLEEVILNSGTTNISNYAFQGCTALKMITLPSSLIQLGECVFSGCTSLETAEIGMGITSIPKYLFKDCTALRDVKLSPKTTTIQSYAFENCKGLEEIHLPPYLTTIQSYAFSGCTNLKNIYAYMPDVPAIATTTFSNYLTSNLYAPAFLWNAYFYDSGWNKFLNVLKCDLRPGDYEAFFTNKDLLFKDGEERITHDRPIVELGNQGAIIVEGASQEFTTVDMERGTTSSSLIGDNNIPMDELRVKVAVNANRWYFLCFPYDVEITECTYPGKYAWREYDAAKRATDGSTGWKNVEGNTLAANKGYIFQSNTAGTLWVKFKNPTFGGNRPQELEAHHSDNAANASWNFVGNPYTCYYNITDEDFSSPITIWNGTSYVAYRPGDDDYHLQPFEAFFVQKPEGADAIAFNAEGRETYRQSVAVAASNARVRKEMGISAERRIVNLGISNNDTALTDRTRLVFNQKAQRAYEMECDAAKFLSDETPIQFYSIENGTQMAINERPVEGDIRLGYVAARKGSYTITAPRMDVPVTLVDNELGVSFDLSQGGYTFETKKGANDQRFTLRFTGDATSILDITEETGVAIGLQEGGVNLGGVENTTVRIYGVNGMLVGEYTANGFVSLPSGTYVVTVGQKSAKVNVK